MIKKILLTLFVFAFVAILPAFAQNVQSGTTEKGALNVELGLDQSNPKAGDEAKLDINFINPQTKETQQHIDYQVEVTKGDLVVFQTPTLLHTATGTIKIPVQFPEDGIYVAKITVEGILFTPITPESVTFNIPIGQVSEPESKPVPTPESSKVPDWVKNNAKWWADDQIDDKTFVSGIQFLIKEKIIAVSDTSSDSTTSTDIPSWIKNNAKWWADGQISEDDFLKGIEFLVKNKIINVS